MILDPARLAAGMASALIAMNAEGDNAHRPGPHDKIRASMVSIPCPLSFRRYLDGEDPAPNDATDAANFMSGRCHEDMILRCLELALRAEIPDFAWDLFQQPDGTMGFQPDHRYDAGFAEGRPDAVNVEHGLFADGKTASASQFAMKIKDGGQGYIGQQAIYAEGLEREHGKPFRCVVAVMNKENKRGAGPPFAVFIFEPNHDVLAGLSLVFERARGDNPACAFGSRDWQPKYCPYRGRPGCGA